MSPVSALPGKGSEERAMTQRTPPEDQFAPGDDGTAQLVRQSADLRNLRGMSMKSLHPPTIST